MPDMARYAVASDCASHYTKHISGGRKTIKIDQDRDGVDFVMSIKAQQSVTKTGDSVSVWYITHIPHTHAALDLLQPAKQQLLAPKRPNVKQD